MTVVKAHQSSGRKSFVLLAAIAYAVLYVAALWITRTSAPQGLKVALSLSALVAFGLFFIAELRLVRELDELEQRIQLEALAFAFPLSIALVMLLGLLQLFLRLPVDDASFRHIWPVMILFYVIGLALARRKYS